MYSEKLKNQLSDELKSIEDDGLFKKERIITSPQGPEITLDSGKKVLNFCANNYLGLSSHPEVIQAAKDALDDYGFGMSSVRFICGTQDIHKALEPGYPNSIRWRILFYMPLALMQMRVFLNLY